MPEAGEFSQLTKNKIAKRAGEKCTICNKVTSKPKAGSTSEFINLGEAAHIAGNKYAPHNRYDPNMSDKERSDAFNAMWLCTGCHKEIDSDSVKYTLTVLHELKRVHEYKISIGEFNNNIIELKSARDKVEILTDLLKTKERNFTLENNQLANEIIAIKTQLELATNEKDRLESLVESLENKLSQYALNSGSDEINNIIKEFKEGNLEKLKEILSEESLNIEEKNLASKNSIKATILEIERDYNTADQLYYKAFKIHPSMDNYNQYMDFSRRYKNIDIAIKISNEMLETSLSNYEKILVYRALGKTYFDANLLQSAAECYSEAISIAENSDISKIEAARTYYPMATIYKEIGNFNEGIKHSLKSIELIESINRSEGVLFEEDLTRAFMNTALLYFSVHDLPTGFEYLKKCENIVHSQEIVKSDTLISLYINIIVALLAIKNIPGCLQYMSLLEPLIEERFSLYPIKYLESYLNLKVKKGEILSINGNNDLAILEYQQGIETAKEFKNKYKIYHYGICYLLYLQYSVLLNKKKDNKCIEVVSEIINIFESVSKQEEIRKRDLANLYALKAAYHEDIETRSSLYKVALKYINDAPSSQFNDYIKNMIKGQIRHFNLFDPDDIILD